MTTLPILDRILESTRRRVAESKQRVSPEALRRNFGARVPLDLAAALSGPGPMVVAEVKRASPSRGGLAPGLDAGACAFEYQDHGAAAISVLTEPEFFSGALADLDAARAAVTIPILRKDFIIDEYQLLEARAHGADAVLLMLSILDDAALRSLSAAARELGLSVLAEVRDQPELERALAAGARLIGINNRDLKTLRVDSATALRLAPAAKAAGAVVVGESGVDSAAALAALCAGGCDAALVGSHLTASGRPGAALAKLLGRAVGTRVKICGVTRAQDAGTASRLGAWAVGLVFVPGSPRVLSLAAARRAAQGVGPGVLKVGVFADQPESEILRAVSECGLDLIQLHGAESAPLVAALGAGRCVKAWNIGGPEALDAAAACPARWLLADRPKGVPGEPALNWGLAARLAARRPRILLAGGLTPLNVEAAMERVRPWGVDVAGGVERSPGVKDAAALGAFFAGVRRADEVAGLR